MKKLIVFTFSILLLSSCQKDNNDCNEAIPYCNEMILQYYQPVCGCNDVTYPNWETAECHGITHYRTGECENWVGELLNLSTASSSLIGDRKNCLNSAQQWEQ